LSVLAGTFNSYDAEFMVNVEQAEKQLAAAQHLINGGADFDRIGVVSAR
jgi:hypothetical protein